MLYSTRSSNFIASLCRSPCVSQFRRKRPKCRCVGTATPGITSPKTGLSRPHAQLSMRMACDKIFRNEGKVHKPNHLRLLYGESAVPSRLLYTHRKRKTICKTRRTFLMNKHKRATSRHLIHSSAVCYKFDRPAASPFCVIRYPPSSPSSYVCHLYLFFFLLSTRNFTRALSALANSNPRTYRRLECNNRGADDRTS